MSVVCFGDSVTYGQGLGDPTTQAFPALLGAVNRGYCGDTTRIALERFPRDVQESEAEVVVIQFGHNDCNRWATDRYHPRVSERAFSANLGEMLARCQLFGIKAILLAPTPTFKGEDYEYARNYYVRLMEGLCPVVKAFTDPSGLLLDQLHPNAEGHRAIADALAPRLP